MVKASTAPSAATGGPVASGRVTAASTTAAAVTPVTTTSPSRYAVPVGSGGVVALAAAGSTSPGRGTRVGIGKLVTTPVPGHRDGPSRPGPGMPVEAPASVQLRVDPSRALPSHTAPHDASGRGGSGTGAAAAVTARANLAAIASPASGGSGSGGVATIPETCPSAAVSGTGTKT